MKAVPLFVLGAGKIRDTRFGCVDIDSVILLFSVKANLEIGVLASKSGDFGTIEGENVIYDGFG